MIIEESLSTPTVQAQNQKRKREMCEPQITLPPPPSSPFQLQPTTPPLAPHILKRMETDICFHCKQQGHWMKDCPQKSQNKNNNNSYKSPSSSNPSIYCHCGHGFRQVQISGSEKNPGRKFFVCPIKRGARCEDFKWCDEPIEESYLQPPLLKYPMCECGAGVCRKRKEKYGFYFVCPIKKDHGSCGFRVSEDELLNNRSIVPFQQTSKRSLDEIWQGGQNDNTCKDLAERGDLLLMTKKTRIVDNPENPSPMAVSDTPDGESPMQEANSQHIDFPVLELDDDDDDIDLDSLTWDVIEASVLSRLSTPSSIRHRQNLFQSDMGIFPSFDSIVVPEQAITPKSDQFLTITHVEASKDLISPNKSPMSQRQREVSLFAQQRLLIDLENFDTHQHESMREAAETTFELLGRLGFECKQFADHIWDFINLVSSMAEIDKSMENSPTSEEHNKFLEEEKAKLAHIQNDYIKTKASFEALKQQRNSLFEEVRHIEAMLHEKQKKLRSCESETVKIETRLCDLKRNMLDVDTTLKDRGKKAELAREKSVDRHRMQIAAKTTLEMAKWELEN